MLLILLLILFIFLILLLLLLLLLFVHTPAQAHIILWIPLLNENKKRTHGVPAPWVASSAC